MSEVERRWGFAGDEWEWAGSPSGVFVMEGAGETGVADSRCY